MRTKWNFCPGKQQVSVLESMSQFMIRSAEGLLKEIVLWWDLKRKINNFSNKYPKVHPKVGVHWISIDTCSRLQCPQAAAPVSGARSDGGKPSAAPSDMERVPMGVCKSASCLCANSWGECIRRAACFSGPQKMCPPLSTLRFPLAHLLLSVHRHFVLCTPQT